MLFYYLILSVALSAASALQSLNSFKDDGRKSGGRFIEDKNIMSIFTTTTPTKKTGPCRYIQGTRKQNHQCRRDYGLADAIKEAKHLALKHCEQQFRYDRWNCSIATRGKRNIFQKVYRETAFVHALTAAALTYSVARACAEGRMSKCKCATEKHPADTRKTWRWGGCSDNLKHGKRVTRNFFNLHPTDGDHVSEILRHDGEVGIQVIASTIKDKCKCHGLTGSCTMKTCWNKLDNFNETAAILRTKYHHAIRKLQSNKSSRRSIVSSSENGHQKHHKDPLSGTLLYLESSPTFCSVTRGRNCLHPDNCATLCCGRGYSIRVKRIVEKCKCRFQNGRCCHLICDICQRYEDQYYCK